MARYAYSVNGKCITAYTTKDSNHVLFNIEHRQLHIDCRLHTGGEVCYLRLPALLVMLLSALQVVACEGQVLNIQCFDGDKIIIINANYGRRDTTTCPDDLANDVECIHEDTRQFVKDRFADTFLLLVLNAF